MTSYNACVDLLDRNISAGYAARPAFIDDTTTLTYGELEANSRRFANVLQALGIRREQRIALALFDTVAYPAAFLGAIRAGIVPINLNTLLSTDQYAYMLSDSRAVALFVSAELLETIRPALSRAPALAHVIVTGAEISGSGGGVYCYEDLMANASPEFSTAETHRDETAFWLYSSGSTGAPKGVKHVHSSLMDTARLYGQGVAGIGTGDVVHSAAKMFFAYGLGNSLSFPMAVGATTILNPARPTPAGVFTLLQNHSPTIFCGVPTLFAAMLHDRAWSSQEGSSRLRLSLSAGEALPAHIGESWKARFGTDILDGVGSTEMLHIFLSNQPGDIVYGTSGRAVPGYDLRLADDNGHDTPEGEIGELYVRGATAAEGYWNQREKSRMTFQGEWTRTGDKYTMDESGRYIYCGRADDMFKVSGIWVSPFEVEAAITSHPSVLEAAVVPASDEDGLLKPKAYIVPKEGVDAALLVESLKDHVKGAIGLWKYPRWVVVVDTLPKTATGKIQRFRLREPE